MRYWIMVQIEGEYEQFSGPYTVKKFAKRALKDYTKQYAMDTFKLIEVE